MTCGDCSFWSAEDKVKTVLGPVVSNCLWFSKANRAHCIPSPPLWSSQLMEESQGVGCPQFRPAQSSVPPLPSPGLGSPGNDSAPGQYM